MIKEKRAVADETRHSILEAAKLIFLENGFDGTSINAIASLAKVNKTLIFHHYENKANLWRKVKARIIENNISPPEYDRSSARRYFESIINYRFDLYAKNPELARLVAWQQVSSDHELLIGNDFASPNHWLKDIKSLQKTGKITHSIDAKLIMLFIIYSSYAPFMQDMIPLSKAQISEYKDFIIESCVMKFSNEKNT